MIVSLSSSLDCLASRSILDLKCEKVKLLLTDSIQKAVAAAMPLSTLRPCMNCDRTRCPQSNSFSSAKADPFGIVMGQGKHGATPDLVGNATRNSPSCDGLI